MRDGFKQVLESVVAVVRHPTLSAKEVVVGRDELAEGHATLGRLLQEVHHFSADLAQLLAKEGACAGSVLFYKIKKKPNVLYIVIPERLKFLILIRLQIWHAFDMFKFKWY